MDIEKKLELLKKIQKVDAPPFMLTRVMERIGSPASQQAPATWGLAFVAAAILVLTLNVSIFLKSSDTQNREGITDVISSMELSTTNNLYHE